MKEKSNQLFLILGIFFVANVILAEFIGVKIFSLEKTLGYQPIDILILGIEHLSLNLTAGVILWPFVFITTDIVNEFYGVKGVRWLSFLSAGIVIYAFAMVFLAIQLFPADFWVQNSEINMQIAFEKVFGQGLWIISGSLTAFLVGQFVDVFSFQFFKKITKGKAIWLRATGSTLISQLIDSFVVLYIAFGIGANWSWNLIISVCLMNYFYKFLVAIFMTPVIYFLHFGIIQFLGEETAKKMMKESELYH